jgi:hypothetical protein
MSVCTALIVNVQLACKMTDQENIVGDSPARTLLCSRNRNGMPRDVVEKK